MNQNKNSMLIVIGASAGGMAALKKLVAQLPKDFSAPVFIVTHMSADVTGDVLVKVLNESSHLPCVHAHNKQTFKVGTMYLAPSDQHMLMAKGEILITKGTRENRSRPAIDPLFRSAAVTYGNRVIGIILTGYLDDGTSGMMAIKRCGGVCIAQDPEDASYPDMPQSVIANVGADYYLPIAEMGVLLTDLLRRELPESKPVPEDIMIEAKQHFATVAFGTEGGLFDEAGIVTLVCGPGSMDQEHQQDEFFSIEQLDRCSAMLDNLRHWMST